MKQTAPPRILRSYKVTMHSDDTICVATCKHCCRQFNPVDRTGRRNWIGLLTHTAAHVREVDAAKRPKREREKGDDDGVEYADPRDYQDDLLRERD